MGKYSINKVNTWSWSQFNQCNLRLLKYKESCMIIIENVLEYMKKLIWCQISEKNTSLAGARTHKNETRPE